MVEDGVFDVILLCVLWFEWVDCFFFSYVMGGDNVVLIMLNIFKVFDIIEICDLSIISDCMVVLVDGVIESLFNVNGVFDYDCVFWN